MPLRSTLVRRMNLHPELTVASAFGSMAHCGTPGPHQLRRTRLLAG